MELQFEDSMLAFCGLYCRQCSGVAALEENDRKHLENIPYAWAERELSEYACEGCKGRNICGHCDIRPCAVERSIQSSCAECGEFPCAYIIAFRDDGMPHHKEAVENLVAIRQVGTEKWFETIQPMLRCEQCGQRQSWYYSCPEHGEA